MGALKKIPFFLLLLVVFFCLHGSVENYAFIDPVEVMMIGGVIILGEALLLLLIFFIARNLVFASLVTFFISLWYLFFGAIQDWIKSRSLLSFLHSYSVLLPLLLVGTVLWVIFLRRNKNARPRLVLYLNILLLVYCIIDASLLTIRYLNSPKKQGVQVAFDISKVKEKPDVYFLLFDEYPGYKSLQDSFAYRNDSIYDFFREKGFQLLPVHSNYNYTPFSMSSIFNMQYVDSGYDHSLLTQQDIQQRIYEIRYGEVFSLFKQMGYRVENYSIFDIGDQGSIASKNSIFPVHGQLLTDKLLHNRLLKDIGWWFATGRFQVPFIRRHYLYRIDDNNRDAERLLRESLGKKAAGPRFSYAHFLMPHGPFFRDSAGNLRKDKTIAQIYDFKDKPAFLDNIKYSNTVIRSLVNKIIDHDTTAVVVVMSDHGFHGYNGNSSYNALNFDNICALRLPGGHFIPYRDKGTTVNFFRYLFNCEFGQQMPYLKDSTIWVNDSVPLRLF